VGVTLREKVGGRGRGGMNFGVVATVCCEAGSRCFAVVVAMAEPGVYGITGESVCDLYGIFSTEAGAGDDGRIIGRHCVG